MGTAKEKGRSERSSMDLTRSTSGDASVRSQYASRPTIPARVDTSGVGGLNASLANFFGKTGNVINEALDAEVRKERVINTAKAVADGKAGAPSEFDQSLTYRKALAESNAHGIIDEFSSLAQKYGKDIPPEVMMKDFGDRFKDLYDNTYDDDFVNDIVKSMVFEGAETLVANQSKRFGEHVNDTGIRHVLNNAIQRIKKDGYSAEDLTQDAYNLKSYNTGNIPPRQLIVKNLIAAAEGPREIVAIEQMLNEKGSGTHADQSFYEAFPEFSHGDLQKHLTDAYNKGVTHEAAVAWDELETGVMEAETVEQLTILHDHAVELHEQFGGKDYLDKASRAIEKKIAKKTTSYANTQHYADTKNPSSGKIPDYGKAENGQTEVFQNNGWNLMDNPKEVTEEVRKSNILNTDSAKQVVASLQSLNVEEQTKAMNGLGYLLGAYDGDISKVAKFFPNDDRATVVNMLSMYRTMRLSPQSIVEKFNENREVYNDPKQKVNWNDFHGVKKGGLQETYEMVTEVMEEAGVFGEGSFFGLFGADGVVSPMMMTDTVRLLEKEGLKFMGNKDGLKEFIKSHIIPNVSVTVGPDGTPMAHLKKTSKDGVPQLAFQVEDPRTRIVENTFETAKEDLKRNFSDKHFLSVHPDKDGSYYIKRQDGANVFFTNGSTIKVGDGHSNFTVPDVIYSKDEALGIAEKIAAQYPDNIAVGVDGLGGRYHFNLKYFPRFLNGKTLDDQIKDYPMDKIMGSVENWKDISEFAQEDYEGKFIENEYRKTLANTSLGTSPAEGLTRTEYETPRDAKTFLQTRKYQMKQKQKELGYAKGYEDRVFAFISMNEGFKGKVYKDRDTQSIGYGFNMNTKASRKVWEAVLPEVDFDDAKAGKVSITKTQARKLFDGVIPQFESIIDNKLGDVEMTEHQRTALLSMAYTSPSLIGPNLTRYVQEGKVKAALNEIIKFSNKSKSQGIQNRRAKEARMFIGNGETQFEGLLAQATKVNHEV